MKKFFKNLQAILIALGLNSKFQQKTLSAEEQASLIQAYNKEYGDNAFAEDFAEFQADKAESERLAAQDQAFKELASLLGEGAAGGAENSGLDSPADVVAAVKSLQQLVDKMGASSQGDTPSDTDTVILSAQGRHTDKFAFGIQHPIFSSSRRYNRITMTRKIEGAATVEDLRQFESAFSAYSESLSTRIQEHIAAGTLHNIQSNVNYTALASDSEIGTRHFTIRQDALIARIMQLPSLRELFPTISNIQSGNIITNVLFTEVSQAYQAGRVFKGDIDFQPEKAIVHKVMAKLQFPDMSAIETSYLNYLNTSGSDPVKWSMIEWIILELAKQINNERNRRAVMGHYIESEQEKPGKTMFASTGVVHRLFGLYDEHKVLPFLSSDLATYTEADMGDVLKMFAELLASKTEEWSSYTVYVNKAHKPWFSAWMTKTYGTNTNFPGVKDIIPDYDLPIKWVPYMGNLPFIFATIDNNINLLENVPGEEHNVQFQRDLEEVIAFSYWKEGAGVGFSGVQKESLAALKEADSSEQMIFMNWPAVKLAADATTAKASDGIIFQTGVNTGAKALTDIVGAKEGIVYRVECGDKTHVTSINKSGKFSEIKSAWTPTEVGEYIKVFYDKEKDKFYEVARGK